MVAHQSNSSFGLGIVEIASFLIPSAVEANFEVATFILSVVFVAALVEKPPVFVADVSSSEFFIEISEDIFQRHIAHALAVSRSII
ncbi:hypothetical protein Nepgr_005166 [Nepenthes gracilis]|uniref:Uncharacterized protein n=1 Tax=Nepenthes gracilis TaxID=150966 RepID=A0AAD3XG61_NEPGR|nr:hypothetical protein Nepgr_005166 [Nepenthes gracilis]